MPPEALSILEPESTRPQDDHVRKLSIEANGDNVRAALKAVSDGLAQVGVSLDDSGSVEIVLAEILNNIVEHAYNDSGVGVIELEFEARKSWLNVMITDYGGPMPENRMPPKKEACIDVARQDLPEGGFGWFLIHELVESLSYMRKGNANVVRFAMRFA